MRLEASEEGLPLGLGDFRFLAYTAGHGVVKSQVQKEEGPGGGHESGLPCTEFEVFMQ